MERPLQTWGLPQQGNTSACKCLSACFCVDVTAAVVDVADASAVAVVVVATVVDVVDDAT